MSADDEPRVLVSPEDLVGHELDGRYRLDSIVGGGGMGVVYRTRQQNLNRVVAIKVLKLDTQRDRHRLDRFRREIGIVSSLSHPNIVRVFDSGRDEALGLDFVVMELVDGVGLDVVMRRCVLAPEIAVHVAHEVCAALTEPHSRGIVHRDIKPANILVSALSDDTVGVKVLDFGIARAARPESNAKITTTGVVVGSPMYMAPEAARGGEVDPRSDLYSVGVLLYEMLAGRTPFGGSTPVAIMLRHAVDEPPSLAESVGDDFALPELVELVDELLAKDPADRPSEAREVLRRLEAIRSAHGLGRPQVDGTLGPVDALAPYRRAAAPSDDVHETEAGPYAPTTPWAETDESRPSSGGDAFEGWLVPASAVPGRRVTLAESPPEVGATDPAVEDGAALEGAGRSKTGVVVAVCAVVGVALAGWWLTGRTPDPVSTPSATSHPGSTSAAVDTKPPAANPPAANPPATPPVARPATLDAGADAAVGAKRVDRAPEAQPHDAGHAAAPRHVAERSRPSHPSHRDAGAKANARGGDDEAFRKGLEWLGKR